MSAMIRPTQGGQVTVGLSQKSDTGDRLVLLAVTVNLTSGHSVHLSASEAMQVAKELHARAVAIAESNEDAGT